MRHHHSWEITEDGNGLIRVNAPPSASGYADADPDDPTKAHGRLNKPVLSAQTISLLVNAYFDHLAHLFPIISRSDFAAKQNPSPLLLYAICGVGATRREFPREVFAGVRGVINGLLRSNDILSDARFEHVQALVSLIGVNVDKVSSALTILAVAISGGRSTCSAYSSYRKRLAYSDGDCNKNGESHIEVVEAQTDSDRHKIWGCIENRISAHRPLRTWSMSSSDGESGRVV